MRLTTGLILSGCLLIVGAVVVIYWPAAILTAGCVCLLLALGLVRAERAAVAAKGPSA